MLHRTERFESADHDLVVVIFICSATHADLLAAAMLLRKFNNFGPPVLLFMFPCRSQLSRGYKRKQENYVIEVQKKKTQYFIILNERHRLFL